MPQRPKREKGRNELRSGTRRGRGPPLPTPPSHVAVHGAFCSFASRQTPNGPGPGSFLASLLACLLASPVAAAILCRVPTLHTRQALRTRTACSTGQGMMEGGSGRWFSRLPPLSRRSTEWPVKREKPPAEEGRGAQPPARPAPSSGLPNSASRARAPAAARAPPAHFPSIPGAPRVGLGSEGLFFSHGPVCLF